MMLKGQDASHIVLRQLLHRGRPRGRPLRLLLANPPFGVEWKKVEDAVRDEARDARASPGGSARGCRASTTARFLFLQHMISKMKPAEQGGSRLAIVFNGSPLFTGAAGSGESEIRRWIIENDWLEAVVALPDQLFYNTGISTYFWIVTNRKTPERRGKVQLVDAREFFVKMRKSLGEKRKEISAEQIDEITRLYGDFDGGREGQDLPQRGVRLPCASPSSARCGCAGRSPTRRSRCSSRAKPIREARRRRRRQRVSELLDAARTGSRPRPAGSSCGVPGTALGSLGQAAARRRSGRARRPRRRGAVITDRKGKPEPDPDLRDNENVPLPDRPGDLRGRPDASGSPR